MEGLWGAKVALTRQILGRPGSTGKGREGVKPLPISRDERGFCISARDLNALGLEASADDGKRRTAVLEVDVSLLRAKGGSLRGKRSFKFGRRKSRVAKNKHTHTKSRGCRNKNDVPQKHCRNQAHRQNLKKIIRPGL